MFIINTLCVTSVKMLKNQLFSVLHNWFMLKLNFLSVTTLQTLKLKINKKRKYKKVNK